MLKDTVVELGVGDSFLPVVAKSNKKIFKLFKSTLERTRVLIRFTFLVCSFFPMDLLASSYQLIDRVEVFFKRFLVFIWLLYITIYLKFIGIVGKRPSYANLEDIYNLHVIYIVSYIIFIKNTDRYRYIWTFLCRFTTFILKNSLKYLKIIIIYEILEICRFP